MPHTPFSGHIPDDRRYDPHHNMWVQIIDDTTVRIGASSFGLFLAGEILAFTSKPNGATVARGKGMGTVECRKTVLAVHAPLSFTALIGNEEAENTPELLNRDPYGAGWMAQAHPTHWPEECTGLLDAAAYRAHILRLEPEATFV